MKHRLHTEQKCRTQNGSGKHETVTQQMAIASAGRGEDLFPELSHYNIKNVHFPTKIYQAQKETKSIALMQGGKKETKRNCL